MQAVFTFDAQPREQSGKGAARALRRGGKIPAIIYGNNAEPVKIALPLKELTLAYHKGGFFNKLVDVNVAGSVIHVLPRDVQTHPVTDLIEHVDFQQVSKDSQVHVMVPVKLLNQERSIGLKRGGVLNLVRHEIELLCSPDAIPSSVSIDVLNADIGHSIHINDITLPPGTAPAIKNRNFTVVTIAGRSKEEEERPAPGAAAAAPAAGKAGDAKAAAKPAAKDDKKK